MCVCSCLDRIEIFPFWAFLVSLSTLISSFRVTCKQKQRSSSLKTISYFKKVWTFGCFDEFRAFRLILIKLWKLLPEKLRNLSSIHTFKNQIRKSERKSLLVDCCQNRSSLCWILWLLSVMNINYCKNRLFLITLVQLVQNNGVHITFLLFISMFKNCKKILDLNFECCK